MIDDLSPSMRSTLSGFEDTAGVESAHEEPNQCENAMLDVIQVEVEGNPQPCSMNMFAVVRDPLALSCAMASKYHDHGVRVSTLVTSSS